MENAIRISGSLDTETDSVSMMLANDLSEDKYTTSGGVMFKFSYQNDFKLELNSVVDIITGENVYGKDLDKKIQFIDDDLKILSPKETIEQALYIILTTTRGSIPEFPGDGYDKTLMTNINRTFTMFPVLFRQLYAVVKKDDTFKSFSLLNIRREEDVLKIDVSVETRLNEVLKFTL
jgi:hypothetical protein